MWGQGDEVAFAKGKQYHEDNRFLVSRGVMKLPNFGGIKQYKRMDTYGNFEGVPGKIVHGLGWQYNDPCFRPQNGLRS